MAQDPQNGQVAAIASKSAAEWSEAIIKMAASDVDLAATALYDLRSWNSQPGELKNTWNRLSAHVQGMREAKWWRGTQLSNEQAMREHPAGEALLGMAKGNIPGPTLEDAMAAGFATEEDLLSHIARSGQAQLPGLNMDPSVFAHDRPSLLLEDGSFDTRTTSETPGILGRIIGNNPEGFFIDPKMSNLSAFPEVSEVQQSKVDVAFGFMDPETRLVTDSFGQEYEIPNLIEGETIRLGAGRSFEVDDDLLAELHKSRRGGGAIAGTITDSAIKFAFGDGRVDTIYGPMPIPRFTDNDQMNRMLMERPEYQRAVMEAAAASPGYRAALEAGAAAVNIAEFAAVMWGTSVIGGAVLKGGGAALKGVGGRFAVARMAGQASIRMGTALNQGGMAGRFGPRMAGLRFTTRQIGEEMWFEFVRNAAQGNIDVTGSIVSGGIEGGIEFGLASVFRVGRHAGRVITKRNLFGQSIAGSTEIQKQLRAKVGADLAITKSEVFTQAMKTLGRQEVAKALADSMEASFVGYWFGVYSGAQELARQDKVAWSVSTAADYMLEAWNSPEAIASAAAFGGMGGLSFGAARLRTPLRKALTDAELTELDKIAQGVMSDMKAKYADDPEALGLLAQAFETAAGADPEVDDVRLRMVQAFGNSWRAGDPEAKFNVALPEDVALEALDMGGPERIQFELSRMSKGGLGRLAMRIRSLAAERFRQGGQIVSKLIEEEVARRRVGIQEIGSPEGAFVPPEQPTFVGPTPAPGDLPIGVMADNDRASREAKKEHVDNSVRAARAEAGVATLPPDTPDPEPQSTVDAQMDAMREGRKPSVLITPGSPMPKLSGAETAVKIGKQGTLIFPSPEASRGEGMLAQRLGYGTLEKGAGDVVVTARDARGRVVQDVQAEPTEAVQDAAKRAAGDEGSVEVRTVQEALRERAGLRSAEGAEGAIGDSVIPPNAEDLAKAGQRVYEARRYAEGNQWKDAGQIFDENVSELDASDVRTLERQVRAIEASAVQAPPETRQIPDPSPPEPTRSSQTAAQALNAAAIAAGQVDEGLAEVLATPTDIPAAEPSPTDEAPIPDVIREPSPFWSSSQAEIAFRTGVSALARSTKSEGYWEVVKLSTILSHKAAAATDPEVKDGATEQLDAMVAGMLVATGLPSGKAEGEKAWVSFIAALSNRSPQSVLNIRDRLIADGVRLDPQIDRALEGATVNGKRLLSEKKAVAHSGRDLLRVLAQNPPAQRLEGFGSKGPAVDVGRNLTDRAKQESSAIHAAIGEVSGRERSEQQTIDELARHLDRVARQARGVRGKSYLDIGGKLARRIAPSFGLSPGKGSGSLVGGTNLTLGQAVDQVWEAVSGETAETRGRLKTGLGAVSTAVDLDLLASTSPELQIPENLDLRADHRMRDLQDAVRTVAIGLSRVRMKDPTGAERPIGGIEIDSQGNPVNGDVDALNPFIRLVADNHKGMRDLFVQNTPNFGMDGGAVFDSLHATAHNAMALAQDLGVQLTTKYAIEDQLDRDAQLETIQRVHDLFDALALDRAGERLSDELVTRLSQTHDFLVPDAIQSGALGPHVRRELQQFMARRLDAYEGGLGNDARSVFFHAGLPLQAIAGWLDFQPDPLYPHGRLVFGERFRLRNIFEGLKSDFWAKGPVRKRFRKAVWQWNSNVWGPRFGRGQRSPAHSIRTGQANVAVRRMRVKMEEELNTFIAQNTAACKKMQTYGLTMRDQDILGKAIDQGAFERIRTEDEWVKAFGEKARPLYSVMLDMVGITNSLGRRMVELGLIDHKQFKKWENHYMPSKVLDKRGKDALKSGLGKIKVGLDPMVDGWARSKSGKEIDTEFERQIYAPGYTLPPVVAKQAASIRVWSFLENMIASPGFVTSDEFSGMHPLEQLQWRRYSEPVGGRFKSREDLLQPEAHQFKTERERQDFMASDEGTAIFQRRRRANKAQTKMEMFLRDTETDRQNDYGENIGSSLGHNYSRETKPLRQIIDAVRDGYVTDNGLMETELLLDMMDPSAGAGPVQLVVNQWRRAKTIQRAGHWILNKLSSFATNHMTGKISLLDAAKSTMGMGGDYHDGHQMGMWWQEYVESGAKIEDLDLSIPKHRDIGMFNEFARALGSSTFERTVLETVTIKDLEYSMMVADPTQMGLDFRTSTGALNALIGSVGKTAGAQARFDRGLAAWSGSPDPGRHADALAALMGQYNLDELVMKFAPYLAARRAGMEHQAAVEWAAEGSGDYGDRNTRIYRLTSRFDIATTTYNKRALEALGGFERGRHKAGRGLKFLIGAPFWGWYHSIVPTLAGAAVTAPVAFFSGQALLYAVKNALMAAFGDEDQLQDAMAGSPAWENIPLSPQTLDIFAERYGQTSMSPYVLSNGAAVSSWRMGAQDFAKRLADLVLRKQFGWIAEGNPLAHVADLGPGSGKRGTMIDFGEFDPFGAGVMDVIGGRVPQNIPVVSDVGNVARDLMRWNQKVPPSYHRGGSVGFLPSMIYAMTMGASEYARGDNSSTAVQATIDRAFAVLAEISAPIGGFFGGLGSRESQKFFGQALTGRSVRDYIHGITDPALQGQPAGERLAGFAMETLLPVRTAGMGTRIQSSTGKQELLRRIFPPGSRPPSPDEIERQYGVIGKTAKRQAVNLYADVYDRAMDDPSLEVDAELMRALDPLPDLNADGTLRTNQPRTAAGKWIFDQAGTDPQGQQIAAEVWLKQMTMYDNPASDLVNELVRKRAVHPSLVRSMLWSTVKGKGNPTDILSFLETRIQAGDAENAQFYVDLAVSSGVDGAGWSGANAIRRDNVMRQLTQWSGHRIDVADPPPKKTLREVMGPQALELAPQTSATEMLDKIMGPPR